MHALYALLAAMILIGSPTALAQAPAGEKSVGIDGSFVTESRIRRSGAEFSSTIRVEFHVTMTGKRLEGSSSRNVLSKDGRVLHSDQNKISTVVGQVGEPKTNPGYSVAFLSGNKLTLLRTAKVGGYRVTITMGRGNACNVRYEHLREVGKGNSKWKGVGGHDVEILSERMVSSTCRLTRG